MVSDIDPGAGSSVPTDLTAVNSTVYFDATDGSHGFQLWKSDGTSAGTVMVKAINPTGNSTPSNLTNVNGELYFSATDGTHGVQLWKSDGTAAGTVMVKAINTAGSSSPTDLVNVNGELFFSATDGADGFELWKSDGTAGGTVMVKDISPGPTGSSPSGLVNVNGELYFSASDGTHGAELWKSDGTAAGTVMVDDIVPGVNGSNPFDLVAINGEVEFYAFDGTSTGLFRSNGSAAGTIELATNVSSVTPVAVTTPAFVVTPAVLNNFSWAQGWGSPNNPREVVPTATNPNGGADYVGFGTSSVVIAFGESAASGPTFTTAIAAIHNLGSAEGYTADVQRGAADTGGIIAPTVYGQGFKGVYWYAATGGTATNPTHQSTANLYPNFGSQQGWTPANGFDVVKAHSTDAFASILGFGDAGIVVGRQAFDPSTAGSPAAPYAIPFAAGNNSGWSQTTDIRSFLDSNGQAIDLNGDGVTDFVGMRPQGLEFAFGSDAGAHYTLGSLQLAQINGTGSNFGDAQGWNDSSTTRDIVKDTTTGFYDIVAFGAAGVYVSMGQDPSTHGGQAFGQSYLAMNNFGSNQGWSNTLTPRLIGDVSGDGIPDIVGFGASNTFTAFGSHDPNSGGHLIFTLQPAATIANYGYTQGWSTSNTVRTLADVDGSGTDSFVISGANGTQTLKYG
jgi:ELWxxDGT repeat protein